VLSDELEGALAVGRQEGPVAGVAQVQVEKVGDAGIVLGDDDRLLAGPYGRDVSEV